MAAATLTSKGQTTIPQAIRAHLKLKTGDRIEFVIRDDGQVLLVPITRNLLDLQGILRRPGGKRHSVEAMNESIRRRFRAR